jgi:prepilin-type N-terminal cleavage/methylation domain-containing protein
MQRKLERSKGFTLLELLIVITIVAVLSAVLLPNLVSARGLAQDAASAAYARNMVQWASLWLMDDLSRRTNDLPIDCLDSSYVGQGALDAFPSPVTNCEILIDPNGPGTFGARVTSRTGKVVDMFY